MARKQVAYGLLVAVLVVSGFGLSFYFESMPLTEGASIPDPIYWSAFSAKNFTFNSSDWTTINTINLTINLTNDSVILVNMQAQCYPGSHTCCDIRWVFNSTFVEVSPVTFITPLFISISYIVSLSVGSHFIGIECRLWPHPNNFIHPTVIGGNAFNSSGILMYAYII